MGLKFDSIDEKSITKEKWEGFRNIPNKKYDHRIERLNITFRFTPPTVGAIRAIDEESTLVQKAFKAIEFCVVEPLGSELSKLKDELTIDEATELYNAIVNNSNHSSDVEAALANYSNEYLLAMLISKETHWFSELNEMSYEDVMQLFKILKDKAKILDYLSEKYHLEHPRVKDDKFWGEMQIMMGDTTTAVGRLQKHIRDTQLKDKNENRKE